uniref:50S ribosomal protein L18, chloroplastic n=1 Tax=Anthurium amnicola TaxID=1678845 RepID=A0A1D1XWF5_9ARAE
MAVSAAGFPCWRPASMICSPPCRGQTNNALLRGHCCQLFTMPPLGRCAPPCTPRVEARASPRKESAKVRNRRMQKKFNGNPTKPRLSVFCSANQLYAMLVDDQNKKTIFYASTLQKSIRGNPPCTTIEAAQRVGEELIKTCIELNVSEISSYDRNGFARGERMQAFEIAIAEHGFMPRG